MDINTTATVGLKAAAAVSLIVCSVGVIGIRNNLNKTTTNLNSNLNTITAQARKTMNQAQNTMLQTQSAIAQAQETLKSVTKQIDGVELKECSIEVKNSLASFSGLLNAFAGKVIELDADSVNLFLAGISDALKCVSGSLNACSDKITSQTLTGLIETLTSFLRSSKVQSLICNIYNSRHSEYAHINNLLEQIKQIQKNDKKMDPEMIKNLEEAKSSLVKLVAAVSNRDCQKVADEDACV